MAKKLNKNLVAGLTLVGFVVTTAGAIFLVAQLRQKDPQKLVELAEEKLAARQFRQATQFFHKAYEISREPIYLVRAGSAIRQAGDAGGAIKTWNRAVTLDPGLEEGWLKLLDVNMEIARLRRTPRLWLEVKRIADALAGIDDQNPHALYGQGLALIRLKEQEEGDPEAGLEKLKRAVEIAPEEVAYSVALADQLRAAGDPESYERLYLKLFETNTTPGKETSKIRRAFGAYQTQRAVEREKENAPAEELERLRAEALKYLKEAIELAGDDPEVISAAIVAEGQFWRSRWVAARDKEDRSAEAEECFEKAVALFRRAIEAHEKGQSAYRALAQLYAQAGKPREAISVFHERLSQPIKREGLRALREKYTRYTMLWMAAEQHVRLATTLPPDSDERAKILDDGEALADDAMVEFPTLSPAYYAKGLVLVTAGREIEALKMFQEADRLAPMSFWQMKQKIALLQMDAQQFGAAMTAIRAAVKAPGADALCWAVYAQLLLGQEEMEQAIIAADSALELDADHTTALEIKMLALEKLGRMDDASVVRTRLKALRPEDRLADVRALMREEKHSEALALVTELLADRPSDPTLCRYAVALYMNANEEEKARAVVQAALRDQPDNISLKALEVWTAPDITPEERIDRGLVVLDDIEDAYTRALEKGRYCLQYQREAEGIEYLEKAEGLLVERATPDARTARQNQMAYILERQFLYYTTTAEDLDRVEDIVRRATDRNVDGVNGRTYVGRLYAIRGDYQRAIEEFSEALEERPNNARTAILLGRCYLQLNRVDEAQFAFERALSSNPREGLAHLGLAMIAERQADTAGLEKHLRKCEKLLPNHPWVREQDLRREEQQDPQAGIERRLARYERDPTDQANLMQLAELYRQTGQQEEAERRYEELRELRGDEPGLLRVLASFYRESGKPERALDLLNEHIAAQGDPGAKANAHILLSTHYQELGDLVRAEQVLIDAADIKTTLGVAVGLAELNRHLRRLNICNSWLRKAIAIADEESSPFLAKLMQQRVNLLLETGDNERTAKAVDAFGARFPDDPVVALLKSEVSARLGRFEQAITELSRFLESNPGYPHALYKRAQYYASQGQWGNAVRDLEELRLKDPESLEFKPRILLAKAYGVTNRLDLATDELESILSEHTDATEVATELVRLYRRTNQFSKAERVLTSLVNQYPQVPQWYAVRAEIALGAEDTKGVFSDFQRAIVLSKFDPLYVQRLLHACIRLKKANQGIRFFENVVPESSHTSGTVMAYAGLLADEGRTADAVKEFRRAAALADPSYDIMILARLAQDAHDAMGGEALLSVLRAEPQDAALVRSNRHFLATVLGLSQVGRQSEALALLQLLLETAELPAEKTSILVRMGMLYADQGDVDNARGAYEATLKVDADNIFALNNLAYLLTEELNDPQQALPYAQRAARISASPVIIDTVGWTYALLERYDEAVGELSRAVQLDTELVPGYYHLGETYRRRGDFVQARATLNTARSLVQSEIEVGYRDRIEESLAKVSDRDASP